MRKIGIEMVLLAAGLCIAGVGWYSWLSVTPTLATVVSLWCMGLSSGIIGYLLGKIATERAQRKQEAR